MVKRGSAIIQRPGNEILVRVDFEEYRPKAFRWKCGICDKEFIARSDAFRCEQYHKDHPAKVA